ncbi:MAG: pectate lyase [Chitinophagales bacterium]
MSSLKYLSLLITFFLFIAFVSCNKNNGVTVDDDNPIIEEPDTTTVENPDTTTIENPDTTNITEVIAFPGAEGFGKTTTGGRGGKIYYVTNLEDSGAGSFRQAVEKAGPRYILFKVSGTIALKSRLNINNGNLTIAGQTAPGDGICIKDFPVVINADNVIIRFMRFRLGEDKNQQADGLECRFHKDIIIDHCSISWSVDECMTLYVNESTTLQWSIVSESLNNSVHEKGAHGYGGIWGGKNASFHHNLLAHHNSRNPRLGETAGDAFALTDLVDLRNNVIYNWGGNNCYGGEAMNVNIVNCYYKSGPASSNKSRIVSIDKNKTVGTDVYDIWGKFYIEGNFLEGYPNATNDNWTFGVYNQFHSSYGTVSSADKTAMRMLTEHPINDNVTTHTAQVAYEKVLDIGGASLSRDAVDNRVIENVRNGDYSFEGSDGSTKGIIDSQNDVGGWPDLISTEAPMDTSGDGIPDNWKESHQLDVNLDQANGRDLHANFDNVEVYINSLVEDIVAKQK